MIPEHSFVQPLDDGAHVFDKGALDALRVALAVRRPLLLRGEPGTGKSQLARAAAAMLTWRFHSYVVDGATEVRDLLYTIDHVARLTEAQVASLAESREDALKAVQIARHLRPGPLWHAFDPAWAADPTNGRSDGPQTPAVVLVDEIDKADVGVPNGLLDALGQRRFDSPVGAVCCHPDATPLVVFTTNEERTLPDAFLRRCVVHHLEFPTDLTSVGAAHFPSMDRTVLDKAANQVRADRARVKARGLQPPGLAEYIDLLRALHSLAPGQPDQQKVWLERISGYVLDKHPRPTSDEAR